METLNEKQVKINKKLSATFNCALYSNIEKVATIKPKENVFDFLDKIEQAHKNAANSKLHFGGN